MKKNDVQMGEIGMIFYILVCILSLGSVWIAKLIIQKAIYDAYKK